ncbi:Similar to Transcription initiation factor IIE subunit beta; acc. no. P79011 [Pyronema omphalodes CBS 100304]|uniref:Transcription initiation factor IIE subunit beta n=1 Tax=Pyronema omphalodes (strain CBS 100304) TaxID=1076935 RepID=U4KUK9_PYROM|nr:Similar to Transcription initiation factor IIE subunit beta; acc. no. P79011 [Pyronema omphalodes CBS 100304]
MSLNREREAFKKSVANAADLFPSRPKPIPAAAAPPPPPTTTVKRKRQVATPATPSAVVYSQPAATSLGGQHIMTQVVHAQQYLKEKERPLRPHEVASYLSIHVTSEVFTVLKENKNPRIYYDAVNDTLEFRPLHNIRSPTDLLAFLQRQTTAQGLPVKELKEGWAGALDAIDTLEEAGDILVIRTKKENLPRMVDEEFKTLWHGIKIPPAAEIVGELESMGLKPASVDPSSVKVEQKKTQKRKRAVNRRGKVSNVHMNGILKDSKDLRK